MYAIISFSYSGQTPENYLLPRQTFEFPSALSTPFMNAHIQSHVILDIVFSAECSDMC